MTDLSVNPSDLASCTPDNATVARRERTRLMILAGILLLGAASRIAQYAMHPSFWHDEAFLVLNVMDKTSIELIGPLDNSQAAPPIFLMLLRGAYVTMGGTEFAMRLVPLVSGLAGMCVFAWVACRVLRHAAAQPRDHATDVEAGSRGCAAAWRRAALDPVLWAVALVAWSPELIVQSVTVKQYSGDVLVASVLLGIVLATRRPESASARMLLVAVVSAVLLWFSHPIVFVFAALALALLPDPWRGDARGRAIWVLGCAIVVVSLVLLYVYSIQFQRDAHINEYWHKRGSFPDWQRWWMLPVWTVVQVVRVCDFPFQPVGSVLVILAPLGAIALWKKRDFKTLTATLGPIVIIFLASLAEQFPFDGSRVHLFVVPGLVLLAAFGVGWSVAHASKAVRMVGTGLAAVIVVWCLICAVKLTFVPHIRSHIRPAVAYLREHRREGETIILIGHAGKGHPFHCYWREPPPPFIVGEPVNVDLNAGEIFWIIGSYAPKRGIRDFKDHIAAASAVADEVDRYEGKGGMAIAYRMRAATPSTQTGNHE